MNRKSLAFGALLAITAVRADGLEPVRIAVSPVRSFAPSNLVVRVMVEPSTDNRVLEVIADGPNFYRSSDVQLDGKEGPSVVQLQFHNVPGGDYEVAATVRNGAGHPVASAHRDVTVFDPRQEQ